MSFSNELRFGREQPYGSVLLSINRLGYSSPGLPGPGDCVERLYYICLCKIPGSRIIQPFRPSVLNLYPSKTLNPQLHALFNAIRWWVCFPCGHCSCQWFK